MQNCPPKAVLRIHLGSGEDDACIPPGTTACGNLARALSQLERCFRGTRQIPRASNSQSASILAACCASRGSGGEGGVRQVLPKGFDIVFEKKAPEIVAHVVCRIVNVSGDPEEHLAVISEDHGVFKGASRVRRPACLGNPVEMSDITRESLLIDKAVAREDVFRRIDGCTVG